MEKWLLPLIAVMLIPVASAGGDGGGTVEGFAEITGEPYSGVVGVPINFTSVITGGVAPYTWNWSFGDGGYGNTQNVSHNYTAPGAYTVTLNVTDSTGNYSIDRIICNVYDISNNPPVVDFSWSPLYPVVGQLVKFTDLSHDYDGNIVSWNWDFGNGKHDSFRNPTTRYNEGGIYVVKLTITDNDGASSSITNMVTVYDKEQPDVNYTLIVYVSNTHDNPIANAKVSISNETGVTHQGYTNENGSIKFYDISGYTVITAEKKGYTAHSTELYIDKDTSVVITLERKAAPQWWIIVPIMLVAVIGSYIYKKKY